MSDVLAYLQAKGLQLKNAGPNNVHTACFFHGEDPQDRGRLYINVDPMADIPGLFQCKVCGEKGAYPSIRKYFGDAAEVDQEATDSENRRAIFEQATAFYVKNLWENKPDVLEWLTGPKRGLTEDTIKERRLGYASGSTNLLDYLRGKGHGWQDLEDTGLIADRGGRKMDFHSGRVTIPYLLSGQPVQIRGRAWPDSEPKYLTPGGQKAKLYNSDVTYRIHGSEEPLLIAEGEFDTIVLEQLGFRAVGVPGAASWQDHWDSYVKEIGRIYTVFDGDAAGVLGTEKLKDRFGPKVREIKLAPPGQKIDPTEWVQQGNGSTELSLKIHEASAGLLVTVQEARAEHAIMQGIPGLKFGYEAMDLMIEPGLQGSQVMVVLAKTGVGKLEPYGAIIPTPVGDKKIEDLVVGDQVFGCNGKPTQVLGVFDQGVQPIRRVHFSDKTWLDVGQHHLWDVEHRYGHLREWTRKTMTTQEIQDAGLKAGHLNREWKWRIPMCDPVQYPHRDLPIDPYTLGALIANGSMTGTSVRLTTPDDEVVARCRRHHQLNQHHAPGACPRYGLPGLLPIIRDLGLHCHSRAKFIPESYLTASVPQRIVLLQGLMDGDGTGSSKERRNVCYSTTSPQLATDIIELVNSLGGTAQETWADRAAEGKPRECTITVMLPDAIEPFGTTRKERGVTKNKHVPHRAIVDIEVMPDQRARCIKVAGEPLYLSSRNYVVTHNTIWCLNQMQWMNMVSGQEDHGWLFLSLEQTRGEWWERAKRIHLFHHPDRTEDDVERFWENRIQIIDKNRVREEELLAAVDDYKYRVGKLPDGLIVDYLGYWAQSFKGERYERTGDAIMALKAVAKELRIPIITPHQVNRGGKDGEMIGSDAARDSGVIEETADFVLAIWNPDNQLGRKVEERSGVVKMRIGKSRHGGAGLIFDYQWAPISLAMVPVTHELASRAKWEMKWLQDYKSNWQEANYRHRTGIMEGTIE